MHRFGPESSIGSSILQLNALFTDSYVCNRLPT